MCFWPSSAPNNTYGAHSDLRIAITALELPYVAGICRTPRSGRPARAPCHPRPGQQATGGRPSACAAMQRISRSRSKPSPSVFGAWRTMTWREGTKAPLRTRFARLRVRIARRDFDRSEPWPEEWLKEPTKYWLSTLPNDIAFARLVDLAKSALAHRA